MMDLAVNSRGVRQDRDMARLIQPAPMPQEVFDAVLVLRDPVRVFIIRELIVEGPQTQATLAERIGIQRAIINPHVKILQRAGIIVGDRQGPGRIPTHWSINLDVFHTLHRKYSDYLMGLASATVVDVVPAP